MASERLISAQKLVIKMAKKYRNDSGLICYDSVMATIADMPTVDAVEVVHGRWEEIGVADYKCSRCGFRFTSADPISMFEYCRCGAKMDGGDGDE